MNEKQKFISARKESVKKIKENDYFHDLSKEWVKTSMSERYVYNFDWLDRPIIQYPQDMVSIQEIIWRTKPDIIIETGIAHGGSLILSASMLALLDFSDAALAGNLLDPNKPKRRVIGVDIEIRKHNRIAIEEHPMSSRIEMFEGSSISADTINAVTSQIKSTDRVMVCLDSMHTHEHVIKELNAYAPLVTKGCYCVVFDTFVEMMPHGFFSERPWDVGNNPMTAVQDWLREHPEFEIDTDIDAKLSVSAAPKGWLKRR